jgi:hypothetical protein
MLSLPSLPPLRWNHLVPTRARVLHLEVPQDAASASADRAGASTSVVKHFLVSLLLRAEMALPAPLLAEGQCEGPRC